MKNFSLLLLVAAALFLLLRETNPGGLFGVPPNVIRWVTQSEEETFGYEVYRAQSEEGPFSRINPQTLLGAGTTDLPQSYEYRDSGIESGVVYWYYVESISLAGERERITPVYASRPKRASLW